MPTQAQSGAPARRFAWLRALLSPASATLLPLIGALVFSYAFFVGAPAWNQNSRFALTRALVEDNTAAIDSSHHTTGDKSFRDGHFYCDKAPGVSFFAVLPYAAYAVVHKVLGTDPPTFAVRSLDPRVRELGTILDPEDRLPGDRIGYSPAYRFALYLCTFFVVVLPTALLGGCAMFLLAHSLSAENERIASWVTIAWGLGTPVWVYSTSLYGHALCGAALLAAFAILELAPKDAPASAPLSAGMLLGSAVLTEYPAAVIAGAAVVFAWRRRSPRDALWVAAGGLPWAAALATYHAVAFGSPLATGYDFVYREEFAEGMAVRYGLGPPDPLVALELLFGSFRGLFYLSPVCLLAAWGLFRGCTRSSRRAHFGAAAFVVLYFWLLNAGYYMWDGGASAGPRHMVPALGFLMLGLVPALRSVPRAGLVLLGLSLLQGLLLAAASPEVAQHGDPLWEFALGRLLEATPSAKTGHTNLGLLLGLPGLLSVLPLLGAWFWLLPRVVKTDP
ncbi:MAG: hypothetical protein KUG77_05965 [Nannocystaceae bacterium]|nr:hypothetical protein [Nannocystaceae bacterium]